MRRSLVVAAMLLALLPAPIEGQGAPAPILQDALGDVKLTAQGNPVADGSALYSDADLEWLLIEETPTDLTWILKVADLRPGAENTGVDGVTYQVDFEHNKRYFRVGVNRALPAAGDIANVLVWIRDSPTAEWDLTILPEPPALDFTADTVTATVPRLLLADALGAVPFPGRWLEGMQARALSTFSEGNINLGPQSAAAPAGTADFMPDAGAPPGRYAINVGLSQTGSARLFSTQPYRASNGEATTFLFDVMASNVGSADEVYALSTSSVPAKLAVILPVPAIALAAGETRSVPVLVTVPFAHDHGAVEEFVLEMRGQTEPGSVGRLAMGISYLAVPQPAGHHDTVYLHVSPGMAFGPLSFEEGYMNTLAEDEGDLGTNLHFANGISFGSAGGFASWRYPLGPSLQMGLDVDLNSTGQLRFTLGALVPMVNVTAEARFYVGPDDIFDGRVGAIDVATMPLVAAGNVLPNAPVVIDGPVLGHPDGDRLPYLDGHDLWLEINVFYIGSPIVTGVADESPYIAPGGFARLPLLEYHDAVDDVLSALGGPALSAMGTQERLVNPGKTVVFPVSIGNPGDAATTYELIVSGSNPAWATLPEARVEVRPHGNGTASLIVRAPADATDGDRADLVLQAYSTKDPSIRGLLRLVAEVDTEADHPDDAETAADLEKAKKSPGIPVALLLVALLLAGRCRRL